MKTPTEPTGTNIKSLAGRLIVFLGVPMMLVATSVSLTVLSFMSMKVEEGETWSTLMGWWWGLMVQDPLYTMVLPVILCMVFILFELWSKE